MSANFTGAEILLQRAIMRLKDKRWNEWEIYEVRSSTMLNLTLIIVLRFI